MIAGRFQVHAGNSLDNFSKPWKPLSQIVGTLSNKLQNELGRNFLFYSTITREETGDVVIILTQDLALLYMLYITLKIDHLPHHLVIQTTWNLCQLGQGPLGLMKAQNTPPMLLLLHSIIARRLIDMARGSDFASNVSRLWIIPQNRPGSSYLGILLGPLWDI